MGKKKSNRQKLKMLANWKKIVTLNKDGDCNGANGQSDGKVQIEDLGKLLALWKK